GRLVFEAEEFSGAASGTGSASGHDWSSVSEPAASGGGYLTSLPNDGTNTGDSTNGPRRDYSVTVDAPGTFYVWARTRTSSSQDDSIHIGLEGTPATYGKLGLNNSSSDWAWRNTVDGRAGADRVTVHFDTAGTHTVNLWMREDGSQVDKIFLTRSANETPSGDGGTSTLASGQGYTSNQVTVTVTTVNQPPEALPDHYTVNEDDSLTVSANDGVLRNDSDPENATLTVSLDTDVSHGALTLHPDGRFDYTPNPNYYGTDQFSYLLSDGSQTDLATVTIEVVSVNDLPVAAGDSYQTDEATPLTIAAPGLLVNDVDIDGPELDIQVLGQPDGGRVEVNDDGSFVYTPDPGFSGSDVFRYKLFDGLAYSDAVEVQIAVQGVNDAPVAIQDAYVTDFETTLTIEVGEGLLANDIDADGDALTIATVGAVSPAGSGTLQHNADGSFTFTPASGFDGNVQLEYTISDGLLTSDPASIQILVHSAAVFSKFYVADKNSKKVFSYDDGGDAIENWNHGVRHLRGLTSNAAGDKLWAVTQGHDVLVFGPDGSELGSWEALRTGNSSRSYSSAQGITTDGTDIWIVDQNKDKVLYYLGGASHVDGDVNAASKFSLHSQNRNPSGITTDGDFLYVLNRHNRSPKVFVYSTEGDYVGNWQLDLGPGKHKPEGITVNPVLDSNGDPSTELWVVDRETDRVYYFPYGTTYRDDEHASTESFQLDANNTNPYGIADPPDSGDAIGDIIANAATTTLTPNVLSPLASAIGDGGGDGRDVDMYKVSLSADQRLTINVPDQTIGVFASLFDSGGTTLAAATNALGAPQTTAFYIPADGDYYIGVSSGANTNYDPITGDGDNQGQTGDYVVNVTATDVLTADDPGDQIDQALQVDLVDDVPFVFDQAIGDNFFPEQDVDLYRIPLGTGQLLSVNVDTPDPDSDLRSEIRIFDSLGREIEPNDGLAEGASPGITYVSPYDGVFYAGISGLFNDSYDPRIEASGRDAETGTYQVTFSASAPLVSDSPGDTLQSALPVTLSDGQPTTFADQVGNGWYGEKDVDFYEFSLALGQTFTATMAQPGGDDFMGFARLFDRHGRQLAESREVFGIELQSSLTYTVESNQSTSHVDTFYLGISGAANQNYDPLAGGSGAASDDGAYVVSLSTTAAPSADLPGDNRFTALPVTLVTESTSTRSDQVGNGYFQKFDVDFFEVSLEYAQTLTIDVDSVANGVDAYLRVFDEFGIEVASDDNSDGTDPFLDFAAPSQGVFFVAVSGAPNTSYLPESAYSGKLGSIGDYTIHFTPRQMETPGDTLATAQEVLDFSAEPTFTASIGDHGLANRDVDLYKVGLLRGDRLIADVATPTSGLDSTLRLFDSDGREILIAREGGDEIDGGDSVDAGFEWRVTLDGDYYIGVSNNGDPVYDPKVGGTAVSGSSLGEYELHLQNVPWIDTIADTVSETEMLDFGGGSAITVSAEIGDERKGPADVDLFALTLDAGQTLAVSTSTPHSTLDSHLRLFNDSGVEIASSASDGLNSDARLVFNAVTAGTYYVGVSSAGNESYSATTYNSTAPGSTEGSYSVQLSRRGSAASGNTRRWISDSDGDWFDASNWEANQIPATGDLVIIDRPSANPTITLERGPGGSGGLVDLASITSTEAIVLDDGAGAVTLNLR
ncbi:MAG: Ig-like domain-containing protein, partial [Planctomycetota bacterium]